MIAALVPKNGVYAELGIFKGDFSKKLHSILQPAAKGMDGYVSYAIKVPTTS
jgi:hypothetical protein